MQGKGRSNPYWDAASTEGSVRLLWTDEQGINREHQVNGPLDLSLEAAKISRKGQQYKHRQNYEGEYCCASSDQMIWPVDRIKVASGRSRR
jgi:hypothetical protein